MPRMHTNEHVFHAARALLRGEAPRKRKRTVSRRGVASVLAMMFLILFGSLVAAMGVSSTGNIRTASSHLRVMRAMHAAETGLQIAEARLAEAASRFVVAEGEIDAAMTTAMWDGDAAGIGDHDVEPNAAGYPEGGDPAGILQALFNHHDADANTITGGEFIADPVSGPAPAGVDATVYRDVSWLYTPAVAVVAPVAGEPLPPAFQIRYAPLADGRTIRVIAEGIVFDDMRSGEPIRRTIARDFTLIKTVEQAIVSPSRVMIGKNVIVEGDIGSRYDDLAFDNGDPLTLRSDFLGIHPDLDAKITDFFASVEASDADGDNRLRVDHPTEGAGIPVDQDYDGDGTPDGAFADATQDGYVDEFDVFIRHYDSNGDGRVTLSAALIAGTTAATDGSAPEFTEDEDLAYLIDSGHVDRNRNNIFGWIDTNGDNRYDPATEDPADWDDFNGVYADVALGWRDGYIDVLDQYAKVAGAVSFTVTEADWVTEGGDYTPKLRGPIDPALGEAPLNFDADEDIPEIDADTFTGAGNDLKAAADGDAFWAQVASQLSVAQGSLATWTTAMNPAGAGNPWFSAVWDDADFDGLPDNAADAYFEQSPFAAPAFADFYYRPVFRNFVFRNVEIPMGLNALFENCQFVGVTYVRCHEDNTHPHWTIFGKMVMGAAFPEPEFARRTFGLSGEDPDLAYDTLPGTAIPPSQILMLADSPLDKGDVLDNEIGSFDPADYGQLPEPLVVDGVRVHDTKRYSNNIRFHDCLFVGSIVSDNPANFTQVRNKMQFTGGTRFSQSHPDLPDDPYYNPDPADIDEIEKSSMLLPNYSVDIGSFNSPPSQNVNLTGAIIAGVLDARGNTEINGALLLTYDPVLGEGPLQDHLGDPIGSPAGFNTTLGYFGPDEGDFESLNPNDLSQFGGVTIVGWDLDGDGIADLPHDHDAADAQAQGGVVVPFFGFGRVRLRHDPDLVLPSGIRLPVKPRAVVGGYSEGSIQ